MKAKYFFCILVLISIASIFNSGYSQENYTNHLLIIKAYNSNNQANKAIDYFKTINTPDANLNIELGNSYLLLNDFKTAANIFLNVNKANPKLCNYELAQCYSQLNKPTFATKYLELYLKQKNKLNISLVKSNSNFAKIISSKEWVELWSQNWYSATELLYNDAEYEYRNKNFIESNDILEKLLKKRPSFHQAYYLMAQNYIKLNKNSHALFAISEALKLEPQKANYSYLKSFLLKETQKTKKALKEITNTLTIDSSNIEYFILRTEIYLTLKETQLAENEIERILLFVQNAKTNLVAGKVYSSSGNYLLALKNYNLSLQKEPNNTEIFILRGDVYTLTKTYEFAEKDYSMALDFFPTRGEIYYKRGMVRAMQKKYNEACSDFKKARNYNYMKAEEALKSYCQ